MTDVAVTSKLTTSCHHGSTMKANTQTRLSEGSKLFDKYVCKVISGYKVLT